MNREKAIATINDMPQDFDLDELMERLVFIEKVEKGLEQLNAGKKIPHAQVKEIIKQWSR